MRAFCFGAVVVLLFGMPHSLLGENVTLTGKTAAYSVENPSSLQGYFNPGSDVEIEEYVKTAGMYRVRFKLPDGNEIIALCRPEDLGKKSSSEGASASGGEGRAVEDFEKILQTGSQYVRTETSSWQFSKPGVEAAPGKGINGSTGMMFDPGQEGQWNNCSFNWTVPGLELQELSFWVKTENLGKGFTIDMFVRSKKSEGSEEGMSARFRIKNSAAGGQTYPVVVFNPDASGWTYVSIILDRAKGTMKVGTSSTRIVKEEDYVVFGPDSWELPTDYTIIGGVGFLKEKVNDRLPVYFDDFSCKTTS